MTQTHSKARQQAESSLTAAQSQFFAKGQAVEEIKSMVQARQEKTLRLREARLAKELEDAVKLIAAPKRVKKRAVIAKPATLK